MAAHARVGSAADMQQFGDELGVNERVEVHVQAVKEPAEPCGDSRAPLLWGEITKALDRTGYCAVNCRYRRGSHDDFVMSLSFPIQRILGGTPTGETQRTRLWKRCIPVPNLEI